MKSLYDAIGTGYAAVRRPDPRIVAAIVRALGDARSVVNVGAGAGSYEPVDRRVVAVEPALAMIRQRPAGAAPVVRAAAESLPFDQGAFDASLAILTVHHWTDRARGLRELARVARRRVVVCTWDPAAAGFWLVDDYFPGIVAIDAGIFPAMAELRDAFGDVDVVPLPIPHDCADGFLGAYWRRPEAYLDPAVRRGMSTFVKLPDVTDGVDRLRRDLSSGTWHRRHAAIRDAPVLDLGYRIVVAEIPRP